MSTKQGCTHRQRPQPHLQLPVAAEPHGAHDPHEHPPPYAHYAPPPPPPQQQQQCRIPTFFFVFVAALSACSLMRLSARPPSVHDVLLASRTEADLPSSVSHQAVTGGAARRRDEGNESVGTDGSDKRGASDGGDEEAREAREEEKSEMESQQLSDFKYARRRQYGPSRTLSVPDECAHWRAIAHNLPELHLYRKHFTSLDATDYFVYAALFTEAWHAKRKRRPVYVDIGATHARRWSVTWFLDRCMGWDGLCIEPNAAFWRELRAQRHCAVARHCVSDRRRDVSFSRAGAFSGVVADPLADDEAMRKGVNGSAHETLSKYHGVFEKFEDMSCTTVDAVTRNPRKWVDRAKATDTESESGDSDPADPDSSDKDESSDSSDDSDDSDGVDGDGDGDGDGAITHIDLVSLDVEGHELPTAHGIDWERVTIDVLVTENRGHAMRTYMRERGYTLVRDAVRDDVWVRNESGLVVDERIVRRMRRFDRKTYRFRGAGGREAGAEKSGRDEAGKKGKKGSEKGKVKTEKKKQKKKKKKKDKSEGSESDSGSEASDSGSEASDKADKSDPDAESGSESGAQWAN